MCGRFVITDPKAAVAEMFGAALSNDLPRGPNFNVCPTDEIAVVASEGGRRLRRMRWGFLPHWYRAPNDGPLLINARAETLDEKPAFRLAARERRCLIPVAGFYEWTVAETARLPWYIYRRDRAPIAMAGIWQSWGNDDLATCAIVTTEANAPMKQVHHRMPVILEPRDWALWLGEAGHGAARLMRPAAEDALSFHRVDPQVNSNRASGAALIAPLAA
jgi:putative SOS response-associated peptidase YedK